VTTSLAYPRLAQLRLTDDDIRALAGGGALRSEQHRGKARYKLRFRTSGGQQVVRCVPTSLVEPVRIELDSLQSSRRAARELRVATRCLRQVRRDAKQQLQPMLDRLGYYFHGTSIRRRRLNH
jgi:hypothetical protein